MSYRPSLTVDTAAVVANWRTLKARFSGRETAAVVKADAYGLGMVPVAQALEKAGCHTFFVASLEEALTLRETLPDVRILVFAGVAQGEEFAFEGRRLIPVLNSREQLLRWKPIAARHVHAVSALHIDTGMGRLGLQPDDFAALMKESPQLLEECRVSLMMSHLACGPEAQSQVNPVQLERFSVVHAATPGIPASFANSAGIYLDQAYHFDLARPGCSLYGIAPLEEGPNPVRSVATWRAPIIQLRTAGAKQTVSYGATVEVQKGTRIATVASGYADGYLRASSNKSVAYLGEHTIRLLGRVTMDMLCFDVSNVPESEAQEGAHITLLGDKDGIRVDDLAATMGTIGYEVLTRIGPRVARHYT